MQGMLEYNKALAETVRVTQWWALFREDSGRKQIPESVLGVGEKTQNVAKRESTGREGSSWGLRGCETCPECRGSGCVGEAAGVRARRVGDMG